MSPIYLVIFSLGCIIIEVAGNSEEQLRGKRGAAVYISFPGTHASFPPSGPPSLTDFLGDSGPYDSSSSYGDDGWQFSPGGSSGYGSSKSSSSGYRRRRRSVVDNFALNPYYLATSSSPIVETRSYIDQLAHAPVHVPEFQQDYYHRTSILDLYPAKPEYSPNPQDILDYAETLSANFKVQDEVYKAYTGDIPIPALSTFNNNYNNYYGYYPLSNIT